MTLDEIQFLIWQKKFGQAQNILGPAEGQGINQSKVVKLSTVSS